MMEERLPPWLDLFNDDYDVELVYAQMDQWGEGAIIDPGEIIGKNCGDADRALRERERRVLKRSLGDSIE
jgi:hypothetical protein